MKKTLCLLLTLCLLAVWLPAAPAEEFDELTLAPAEDAGLEAVEAGEAMPGVVTEGLLADGLTEDETGEDETAPQDGESASAYLRLTRDAALYGEADCALALATLPGGSCLLRLGDEDGALAVAFAANGRVCGGYVRGEDAVALDEAEADALVGELAAGGEVLLYEGDLDRPLPVVEPRVEGAVEEKPEEEEPIEETPVEDGDGGETTSPDTADAVPPSPEGEGLEEPEEEEPVEETPVEDTPVEGGDGGETTSPDTADAVPPSPEGEGLEDTPVEDTPIKDTPVEDTPIEETPIEDTPVEDTPVGEEPVVDAPEEEDDLPVEAAEDAAPVQGADDPDAGADPIGADDPDAGLDPQATLAELSPEDVGAPDAGAAAVLAYEGETEYANSGSSLDDDALFAGYASRFFGVNRIRARRTMATDNAGAQLTGNNRVVYDLLKAAILEVAAGERSATEFTIPVSTLLGGTRFTASQLGLTFEEDVLTDSDAALMRDAFRALYDFDFYFVYDCLWMDCTYELFWLDRYDVGTSYQSPGLYVTPVRHNGDFEVYVDDDACFRFRFPVLDQYAGGDQYTMDVTLIDRARTAAENARAIVSRYAGESDYVKMYAYAVEICDLVEYNTPASAKDWQDANPQVQDPWKLIWVFDGDSSTDVVCEGYAQAFTYLCELSDFSGGARCYMVSGTAGGAHSWNIVRMGDGKSYVVDVTWMDGDWSGVSDSQLADWINEERGGLFLCGASSGSVDGGYAIDYRTGSRTTSRTYWDSTLAVYPASVLTLAQSKYCLTGWQTIRGSVYYFDEGGKYLTGTQELDGSYYQFASDGKLQGAPSGWQEIDGRRYFFEADGTLHTQHTAVDDPAVAATCDADGLTAGSHCSVCGEVLAEQTVVPGGHSWGAVSYTWSEDNGSVTARRVCARDGSHVQTETVTPAKAVAQAATCTAKGKTKYTAKFTNSAFAAQTRTVEDIPAKGHTPVTDAAVAATCLSSGLTAGTHCSACGAVLTAQQTVPAQGHSWGAVSYTWAEDNGSVTARRVCANDAKHVETETAFTAAAVAQKPTCTAAGKTKYTATFKNAAFAAQSRTVADIPALGHSWGETSYTWAEDNGSVTARRVCAHDAGHVETETVQTTSAVAKAATCTAKGKTKYTAKFTNSAFAAQTRTVADIPALGHSWGEAEYTWADDNTSVTARRVCAHDAAHVQTETVQTTSVVARAATCTVKGKTKYTAKFKNAAFASQTRTVADIPANGHSPVTDAAVAPTYTRTGLTEGSHCEVCGKVLVKQKKVAKKKVPSGSVLLTKNVTKTLKAGKKLTILLDGVTAKSYKSSKTAVAAVSKKGVVTAKLAGTAKITVTLKSGKKLVLTVKVTDTLAPKRVQLKQGRTATMKVGKKLALTPILTPVNARTALTWTSSDTKVATVTQKGVVKARKKGTVTIVVTAANGKKASIKIKVK